MRGDIVTVVVQGDFGKPRPALVIQADLFDETGTVTLLLVSSTLVDAPLLRIPIHPSPENGLRKPSQIMIDKAMTVKRSKLRQAFGRIDADTMVQIERCLAIFLGIAS